jgi:exosortase A-associated hydrolase 1
MNLQELPLLIPCEGSPQVGIFHKSACVAITGIVMVVAGGPQYRVGRARQLVIYARRLVNEGYPVLRFDYRGLGDSAGKFLGFENIDADIKSAIDALKAQAPDVENIILWGECNSASAIMMYAWQDQRVKGMIICNPWVYDESTQAKTYIKYYFLHRLQEKSFWLKLFKGQFNIWKSFISILDLWHRSKQPKTTQQLPTLDYHALTYQEKMLEGFSRFSGKTLLIKETLSLTGKEFELLVASSDRWQKAMQNNNIVSVADQVRKSDNFSLVAYSERLVKDASQWISDTGF